MVRLQSTADRVHRVLTPAEFEDENLRSVSMGIRPLLNRVLLAYVCGLGAVLLGEFLPAVVRVPIVVLVLTFVPGSLFVLILLDVDTLTGALLLYAVGTSLVLLMAVGALANLLLPLVGISKPLTLLPLAASVTVLVALLWGLAYRANREEIIRAQIPPIFRPAPLAFVLVPLLAIIGVSLLNRTGNNVILLFALIAIALLPLIAVRRIRQEWYPFGVWALSLAILYHKSLWQFAGFSGRPHGIQAWEAGRWTPGLATIDPYTSELLPNGVLFPLYARLSGVFILTQYEVVNPFLVSFIPVAVFVAARRCVDAEAGLLAALTFAFVHPFYLQYPTAGRAASPVIFLTLFGVVLTDTTHRSSVRAFLATLFLAGVVVSHYGTSYYVMISFAAALVVLVGMRRVLRPAVSRVTALTDGGRELRARTGEALSERGSLFSASLVAYLSAAALTWYMFMRGGAKFQLLPRHVVENLNSLLSGSTSGGRTAARIQKNYGTVSIEYAKILYILIAILIALGLLIIFYRYLTYRHTTVDERYFAIAGSMFAIFGTTLILRNWGGGRPMMIAFSFSTVFAVIAAVWLANKTIGYGGSEAFAVMLAMLFLLNTGVVAVAVGGFAPSNVPAQPNLQDNQNPEPQVTVHRPTDIATHVWVVQYRGDSPVFADTYGARQFDWFRPPIAARTPRVEAGYHQDKPEPIRPDSPMLDRGYLIVLGHNQELNAFWPARFEEGVSLDEYERSSRSRVYTTGESSVYIPKSYPANETTGT